ncbi:MAG TPA: carbon-nitrogen hydrolase family protein [Anaerolineales bacterium]|nr:carbon-nitrogen hydrolase family protein [Anaerolineales bacterium]
MTKAKITTLHQGYNFYGSVEKNREYMMSLLDTALRQNPDLVCLPEAFTSVSSLPIEKPLEELAETLSGPTIEMVAKKARKNNAYIICPLLTKRDDCIYNSAVIIDRAGDILGVYDKVQPVTGNHDYTEFEGGITPGTELPVFNLDFGRIGIQICFDLGFPESWAELARKGAQMVLWPSAYNGGFPLQTYAYFYGYYVVSAVRANKSRIIDPLGNILVQTSELVNIISREINLDFSVVYDDFNWNIPREIMDNYAERVDIRANEDDGYFLVEPTDNNLTIAHLQQELGFESHAQYHQRHRDAYARFHQGKALLPQNAAHGDRPSYTPGMDEIAVDEYDNYLKKKEEK